MVNVGEFFLVGKILIEPSELVTGDRGWAHSDCHGQSHGLFPDLIFDMTGEGISNDSKGLKYQTISHKSFSNCLDP